MRQFSATRGSVRIEFGRGASRKLVEWIEPLGVERVAIVSSARGAEGAERLRASLGARGVSVVPLAREHVPTDSVSAALQSIQKSEADAVLALGGGSSIGLAKALALKSRVRVIAIPTTYSGSEMTPIWGMTESGEKRTGRDERVRPSLVIYDPDLLSDLPSDTAVASLWNAMAHAVEALWMPIDRAQQLVAEEALALLGRALLVDGDARCEAGLEGAYLAGSVFGDAGAGLHHKLCHVLGGMFGLPHAKTHAALLPHVVRFQRSTEPVAMAAIARALGVLDPVAGLERLARVSGAPSGLEGLGMPRDGIERAVDAVRANPAFSKLDPRALVAMIAGAMPTPTPRAPVAPLRAPATLEGLSGFGSNHESEAVTGALPRRQNAPHPPPLGLLPELLSGTPFTTKNAENSRVWLYRVRASFAHGAYAPLPSAHFAAPLLDVDPNRQLWQPLPIPDAPESADFLDGMVTLGGAGDPTSGPGYLVHMYAANRDMEDRAFSSADGDLLIVPQEGTLECRTELGWLRAAPGTVIVIPRALKFAIGLAEGKGRGFVLEVFGPRLRLPERGLIGSNGLADARHFLAPVASFEDRLCPDGFELVTKLGGNLFTATQEHSPFDVVAWHGNHAAFSYDLSLFAAMGSVTFDHPDPSILTVLSAPLDDHGRAVADFVVFPGRWNVIEHSFRPPFMHRNAASEINMVIRNATPGGDYAPGCIFVSPILTAHGVSTKTYDRLLDAPPAPDVPERIPDESLWVMFESAMPFRSTAWARQSPLLDRDFRRLFEGMKSRFRPNSP
jgi:homogentisate 1,2-dioxygenase